MPQEKSTKKIIIFCLALIICGVVVYYNKSFLSSFIYSNVVEYNINDNISHDNIPTSEDVKDIQVATQEKEPIIPVIHLETPDKVRALYMSAWVAGSENFRNSLIKIIDETELNSVVIDIKDSTGRISFLMNEPMIKELKSAENRIKSIRELTSLLHSKNIYIIGRISVFQDPYLSNLKPEWAIKKLSDGKIWKDKKGLSFLDPTNKNVHNYILSIANVAYNEGFDEINLDYIRYPSDGDIKDINYNLAQGKTRADNIEAFFKYISTEMKKTDNIILSGDVFGLTTEATDDMGIGQVWEKAISYFDYICPMVYPSHYPTGYAGYKNPALYPYEVINRALKSAVDKTKAIGQNVLKIRPWLQDFDLGASYTKEMIKTEIKATYDNGLNSWMLWDPGNKYTPDALMLETTN